MLKFRSMAALVTLAAALTGALTLSACKGAESTQSPVVPNFQPTGETPTAGAAAPPVLTFGAASPAAMVTDMANGWPVALQNGQEVVIRLAANKASGYSWVVTSGGDAGVLEQQGAMTYEPAPAGAVGAGGTEVYRFRGTRAGEATLGFAYRRLEVKDESPARTVAYPVTVK